MCGIFCIYSKDCPNERKLLDTFQIFKQVISNRGPDSSETKFYKLEDNSSLFFAASVLWLQGPTITNQPVENTDSIFVYNGDVFGGIISDEQRSKVGDTKLFLDVLEQSEDKAKTLANIQGPYAFVYLDKCENKLYFGRDIYGRRSLLIGKLDDTIILTSVAKRHTAFEFMELPSIGIFCLDLTKSELSLTNFSWKYRNKNYNDKLQSIEKFLDIQIVKVDTNLIDESNPYREPTRDDLALLNSLRNCENPFDLLLQNQTWLNKVQSLKALLETAIAKRIAAHPTGILFSGGVDCAILALLADQFIDSTRSIDLLNVAFPKNNHYETPDRLTAQQTLAELEALRPNRQWKLIELNIPLKELRNERQLRIADLIYPLDTILDDSLGCALWFASRGCHQFYSKVLLVGMGADELFGGYTRHRAALKNCGWKGLHDVLAEDWQNLSHRNLARDDRVVSDHGRQLRTPYLDEDVVQFVRGLHSWEKSCPSSDWPQGVGEKILLRSLAYYLGLKGAALLKKRAFQFGSRIANAKENGRDVSKNLI